MFCCVPGCTSRYGKDKISFHQFPKNNAVRFQKWVEAVGGKMAEASSGAFVCGRHFVGGKAAKNSDTDSPDWIPTLYMDGTGPPGAATFRRSTEVKKKEKLEEEPVFDFDDEPNVRCLVRGCAMARDDTSSMLFFPVPKEEPERGRWFQLMGITKPPPVKSRPTAAVCELHFELAKDLSNYDDFITLGVSGVLRPGVLPTRNVPGTLDENKISAAAAVGSCHEGEEGERMEHEGDASSLLQEMSLPMDTNGDEVMPEYPDHMQTSPVEEFVHVCRSCLSTDKANLVSGFEDNLAEIFFQFTSVAISKSEGISTDFCHDCRNRLMELHFFRDTCLTSTQILIHRYQKSNGMADDDGGHGDESSMMAYGSEFGNGSIAGHNFATEDPEDLLVPQKEEAFWDKSDEPKKPRRGRPPRQSLLEAETNDEWVNKGKRKLVKKRYNCKVCFKEYNSRVGLDSHQATHKNDNPEEFTVPCEKCPVMRRPGDKHSCHVNAMRCHMCPDQFRSWSYLKIHLAKVHRIKTKRRELMAMMNVKPGRRGRPPADSLDISGNFSGNSTMISSPINVASNLLKQQQQHHLHQLQLHPSSTPTPQTPPFHKCGFCEAAFKVRATLDVHLRTHSQVTLTECSECGESFDSFRALERHFDQHQDHSSDNKSGLMNKCHMCGKVLRRRQTLMLHRQYVHCDGEIVKCSTCPRLLPNAKALAKHQCPARGKQSGGDNINGDFIIVKPESILKGGDNNASYSMEHEGDQQSARNQPVVMQEDNADPLLGLGNEDVIELGSDDEDDDEDEEEEEDDESSNQTSKSQAFTCNVCGKVFEKEDVLDRHMKLHRMMSAANARK